MSNSAELASVNLSDWIQSSILDREPGLNDSPMGAAPSESAGLARAPEQSARRQGRWWILTIPELQFVLPTELPVGIAYLKGQLELGEGGFRHWQLFTICLRKSSLASIKRIFGQQCHAELTRSDAAEEYVWKEETRVAGTQFELGSRPHRRNASTDWESVWNLAVGGNLLDIEHAIRVQHYRTLRQIGADFAEPIAFERKCYVFCGPTGTGKSRRAWREASVLAYPKDPRTKFWCGYRDQANVVIDEFRGGSFDLT